jgi:hypothetical protein
MQSVKRAVMGAVILPSMSIVFIFNHLTPFEGFVLAHAVSNRGNVPIPKFANRIIINNIYI